MGERVTWPWLWLVLVMGWGACGDETAVDDDDAQAASASSSGHAGSGGSTGVVTSAVSVTTGGGGGGAPPLPALSFCLAPCTTPADCAQPMSPAFDQDNYACEDGACRYTGCHGDAECQAMGDFVCRAVLGLSTCVVACSTSADCASPSPAFDADNYGCEGGGCVYTGCNGDAECQQSLGPDYVCRSAAGSQPTCIPACTTVADCDLGQPANDPDNYTCDGGLCIYTGCNSDAECMQQGDLVCR